MTWPPGTWQAHERFCIAEAWDRVRDARGRTGSHHVTYELVLADGSILRTRISHPVDRTDYGPSLWNHILRDQLAVSAEEFWSCVNDGVLPARSVVAPAPESLPADLVHLLVHRVGLSSAEIASMTRAQAIERLQRHWVEGQ
jgi:hypothetical protein